MWLVELIKVNEFSGVMLCIGFFLSSLMISFAIVGIASAMVHGTK